MAALDSVSTAQEGEELELDWISQLPDELLMDIVSRLTYAEAIRTVVLSSRWINLWKSAVRELDLDSDTLEELAPIYVTNKPLEKLQEKRRWYINWVNGVVSQMKQSCSRLTKFRLDFNSTRKCNSEGHIDRWLRLAISKRVESLHLAFNVEMRNGIKNYVFPKECYNHIKTPAGMHDIRLLRSLRLSYVDVRGKILEHFIANCPVLEELVANHSELLTKLKVVGSSHSPLPLKHLEVTCCRLLVYVEIDHAPHLERLILDSRDCVIDGTGCMKDLRVGHCPSLVDMTIGQGFICNRTCRALSGCTSRLVSLFLKSADHLHEPFPDAAECNNLERLRVQVNTYQGHSTLIGLIPLINVCPRLHTLQLFFQGVAMEISRWPSVDVVKVHRDSIKVVEVFGFRGYAVEYEFMEYVMKYFVGLERIVFDCSTSSVFSDDASIGRHERPMLSCGYDQRRKCRKLALELKSQAPPTAKFLVI